MTDQWVFLRGLAREAAHWGDFPARFLAAMPNARVACPDLPGNGSDYRLRSPLSVPAMVEHCRAALQAQRLAPPYWLLALSLGGMAASAWCRKYPHEIAGAVLINTSFPPMNPVWQRLRPAAGLRLFQVLLQRDAQAAERHILHLTSSRPHAHGQALTQWIRLRQRRPVSRINALRQLLAAARYQVPRRRPASPILLLASDLDQLVDPRCSRAIAKLWQAECAVHPQAGHDLPLDDGDWVAAQVASWTSGLTRRGADNPTAAHAAGTAAARNRPGAGS